MENRTKRKRPEYLYAALLFIGAALLLVILIVCGSCEPKKEPAGTAESSAVLSQGDESSGAETSAEDESSVAEESSQPEASVEYSQTEVPTAGKMTGILALTDPTYAAGVTEAPEGLLKIHNNKNDTYGLSGTGLTLHADAIDAMNKMPRPLPMPRAPIPSSFTRGISPALPLPTIPSKRIFPMDIRCISLCIPRTRTETISARANSSGWWTTATASDSFFAILP